MKSSETILITTFSQFGFNVRSSRIGSRIICTWQLANKVVLRVQYVLSKTWYIHKMVAQKTLRPFLQKKSDLWLLSTKTNAFNRSEYQDMYRMYAPISELPYNINTMVKGESPNLTLRFIRDPGQDLQNTLLQLGVYVRVSKGRP